MMTKNNNYDDDDNNDDDHDDDEDDDVMIDGSVVWWMINDQDCLGHFEGLWDPSRGQTPHSCIAVDQ